MKHHYGYHSGLDSPNDWEIRSRSWVELTLNRCFYVNLDWNLESSNFLGVFQGTLTCTYLYNQISRPAYFFDTPADCLFATPSVEFMFSGLGASSKKCRRKNQPEPKNGLLHKTRFQHIPSNKKSKIHFEIVPFQVSAVSFSGVSPKRLCGLPVSGCPSRHSLAHQLPGAGAPPVAMTGGKGKVGRTNDAACYLLTPPKFQKSPWKVIIPKRRVVF